MPDNHDVEIALAEYEACSDTRNHYDNIRWTIGSIFIAVSLGLFGLSFTDSLSNQLAAVVFTFLFSLSLILVWYLYFQHVNPYVVTAILRAHKIEKFLSKKYPDGPRLNKEIWETEKIVKHIKGVTITLWLFASTVILWMSRIGWAVYLYFGSLTSDCYNWFFYLGIMSVIILFVFWIVHRLLNPIDIGKEIEEIWNKKQSNEHPEKTAITAKNS